MKSLAALTKALLEELLSGQLPQDEKSGYVDAQKTAMESNLRYLLEIFTAQEAVLTSA